MRQVLSEQELQHLEEAVDGVDGKAKAGLLPAQCFHTTVNRAGNPKRTKFFFGARCELSFLPCSRWRQACFDCQAIAGFAGMCFRHSHQVPVCADARACLVA